MAKKKILSIEDLIKFCEEQHFTKFSAKESGYQLCVEVPAVFEKEEYKDDSLLIGNVKLMHTSKNRNGSALTEKAAKECLSTIAYKPILANFCNIDGVDDFTSHDMEIDDDGNIIYIEKQVGCFTADKPTMDKEADSEGRKYIYAKVAIPRDYTKAAEIIERKGGTKISAELGINEMSYSASDKVLYLDSVVVMGATLLGKNPQNGDDIEEGMQGARLDIADFSEKNNSLFSQNKLIESLDKLTEQLSRFNINPAKSGELKEGGNLVNKFEELLEKYNKKAEDITFDHDGLTDKELEAKFVEAFDFVDDPDNGDDTGNETLEAGAQEDEEVGGGTDLDELLGDDPKDPPTDPPADPPVVNPPAVEPTEEETAAANEVIDAIGELSDEVGAEDVQAARDAYDNLTDVAKGLVPSESLEALEAQESRIANINSEDEVDALPSQRRNNSIEYAVTYDGVTKTNFATLNEQLEALFVLVNDTYGEMDNEWYSVDADPDKKLVYMHGWSNHYRQSYKVKNDVFSLVGDRTRVSPVWLSDDEKKELENFKSNYAAIESELGEYKNNELHAQREAVFAADDYSVLAEDADFVALKEAMDEYSPKELSEKADLIYAKFMKANHNKFSVKPNGVKNTTVFMSSGDNADDKKRKPYGGIFDNYFKNRKK